MKAFIWPEKVEEIDTAMFRCVCIQGVCVIVNLIVLGVVLWGRR